MTTDEYLLASNQGILIALAREGHVSEFVLRLIQNNYADKGLTQENCEFINDILDARGKYVDDQIKQGKNEGAEIPFMSRKYVNDLLSKF